MALALLPYAACTVGAVKQIIDPALSGEADNLIQNLINGFSLQLQKYLRRNLFIQQYDNYFSGGRRVYVVNAPPINTAGTVEVWEDITGLHTPGNGVKLTPYLDYEIPYEGENGEIRFLHRKASCGARVIRINFPGGIIKNDTTGITCPADLRMATAMQVSVWYRNRSHLDLVTLNSPDGTATFSTPSRWIPEVLDLAKNYIHPALV